MRELRFHDLRHTFGTRMAAAGVPLRTLQEWLGDRDFTTTLVYADDQPSAREAELVDALASATPPMRRSHETRTTEGAAMPKYLFQASYTPQGVEGIRSNGGSSRRDAVAAVADGLGGSLESFYFAFGESDVYTVVDLPDNETATAVALTVNASGAVAVKTTVLLTPEEVDAAANRSVDYRPPGG